MTEGQDWEWFKLFYGVVAARTVECPLCDQMGLIARPFDLGKEGEFGMAMYHLGVHRAEGLGELEWRREL